MNILVLVMGGSGTRLGGDIPKQYRELNGVPIFGYILEKYNRLECIDKIVIVSNKDYLDYVNDWVRKLNADKVVSVVPGGNNRSESVKNGINSIASESNKDDIILFHDATHPYVDEEGVKKMIDAIKECGGATLAQYNYDTVYEKDENDNLKEVVPRANIVAGASPEGFTYGKIYDIYNNSTLEELEKMTSAGAIALANNINMKVIECDFLNLKITYKRDLLLLKKLLLSYYFTDFNYDKYDIDNTKLKK